jgi:NAD(P)H-flavin reductase
VYGPLGRFLLEDSQPAVFLAGGIGVSPFRAMLRYAADGGRAPPSIDLFYSARAPEELIFREELDAIARSSPRFTVHYTVTRPRPDTSPWEGRVGRIDPAWVQGALDPTKTYRYYVAGLPEMVNETITALLQQGQVPREAIAFEMFRGY